MREGNNLAPITPVENVQTLYEATKIYGRYLIKELKEFLKVRKEL